MKKNMTGLKIFFVIMAGLIIVLIIGYLILASRSYNPNRQIKYGVTFSKKFALQLGLDWRESYLSVLDDLQVKYLRLPAYWEDIEPEEGQYFFEDIDWQISEAEKRDVRVILVVGRRQPRWPECHDPKWVDYVTKTDARKSVLKNIEIVVNRYKNSPALEIWQVENEPFLDFFGRCPHLTKKELQEEVDLVKSLDRRKILITDSGELSTWHPAIKMGDLFGTTVYRVTHNKYIGYWRYFFIPASYYRVKAAFWGRPIETTYVAELQAEPWFPNGPLDTSLDQHYRSMDIDQLIKNAEYARKSNLERAYFWGVEWWYWLKKNHSDDSIWNEAKKYF
ncbi:MAG TPA: hypothetical protein ENN28_04405 [Candidatus Uhrbacteria bacterium]|nr:hypothetical protein [Candidatus Uhrbacteria bacterium]